MIFFPNCKINVGLDVISRRDDGLHEISTLMVPVTGWCDILEIVPGGKRMDFTQSGIDTGAPGDNLCVKAWELVRRHYDIPPVRIHLHKTIPTGAGLGGGSSDAAFTIKGLNRVFGLGLPAGRMEELAAELGSDTAFFIRNIPQLSSGRGEKLTDYPVDLQGYCLVIVKPEFGVPTAEAYSGITPLNPGTPLVQRLRHGPEKWKGRVANAFEHHIFEKYPILKSIKEKFYGAGAVYASMSGSGSAVFGLFRIPDPAVMTKCGESGPGLSLTTLDEATAGFVGDLRTEAPDITIFQQLT